MNYCVVDLETTGLQPHKDKITEIGCLRVVDGVKETALSILVNPHVKMTNEVIGITNITQEMVETEGIEIKPALDWLQEMTEDCEIIVGHNFLMFDHPFIMQRAKVTGHRPILQSMKILKIRDTAAWFKGMKLGNMPKSGETAANYAGRIMKMRVKGLKYNLQVACDELGLEWRDVDRHRAYGDIELARRVYEALWPTFESFEKAAD